MADEIIKKLWKIKDGIAREYGYDMDALVAYLTTLAPSPSQRIVDLRATRTTEQAHPEGYSYSR